MKTVGKKLIHKKIQIALPDGFDFYTNTDGGFSIFDRLDCPARFHKNTIRTERGVYEYNTNSKTWRLTTRFDNMGNKIGPRMIVVWG